jgi:hypothetical protein
VVAGAGDFLGLLALEEEAHGLDPVGLPRAEVLLLAAAGDFEAATADSAAAASSAWPPRPAIRAGSSATRTSPTGSSTAASARLSATSPNNL